MRWFAIALVLTGCGRIGFDALGGGSDMDASDVDSDAVAPGIDASLTPNVGEPVRITTAAGTSQNPRAAFNGDELGVVWDDDRSGSVEIYFARLDPAGQKLGNGDVLVSSTGIPDRPQIAWTGSSYAVVWREGPNLMFRSIDANGALLGVETNLTNGGGGVDPALVWTGTRLAASYSTGTTGATEIQLGLFDYDGSNFGSTVVRTGATTARSTALLWTGSHLLVSWEDRRSGMASGDIFLRSLSGDGLPLIAEVNLSNDASWGDDPCVAATGESNVVVLWDDNRLGAPELYARRSNLDGALFDEAVALTNTTEGAQRPRLAFTGSMLGAVWDDFRNGQFEIYFALLDELGSPIGPQVRATNAAGDSTFSDLLWTGSRFALFWTDARDGDTEIYFKLIDL